MLLSCTRIDVTNLHPWSDINTVTYKTAQDAGNTRRYRKLTVLGRSDNRDLLTSLDKITYLSYTIEFPCSRCSQQALYGIAADGPGHACVWLSTSVQVDASQVVPPIGLDHGVDIFPHLIACTKCQPETRVSHC